ncbi:MAG: UDP-N-acetylglucosamine 2-epimerase (non-hydrolyzing) [Bacteroidetes bacterium]|nr:UDP-N-acetylglucosamine 2-epimerase (non-hydrolyzing) [Bacteroidota bacterium]MBP6314460.1 UDP-N-acetylglucosamine 2-epimerase (non-hydrolyzing) [Chitinophagaceae bacterium]
MKKIISIVGARPQFIKHAPMQMQLQQHFDAKTIHTGQHYDSNMSQVFFEELKMPKPDFLFDMGGSKPQGEQTGIMLTEIEKVCMAEKPDALLVYGDTNSTLAGALVAAKMHIPQIHIEAGLRSFNRDMPEEINRIVADEFAYMLFCPTDNAIENLRKEGITHDRIFRCGDVMCDMVKIIEPKSMPLVDYPYYFVTIHRPYNTDDLERLTAILNELNALDKKVIFSIHPRTVSRMEQYGISTAGFSNIVFIAPQSYAESISYQKYSDCVITDSGGIQKEAYILRKKCITLRSETEWTETLHGGWNTLVFEDLKQIRVVLAQRTGAYIDEVYGKGNAAEEITDLILKYI